MEKENDYDENPPDWNKIGSIKEKWIFFAMGYFCGLIAGFIVIYIITH